MKIERKKFGALFIIALMIMGGLGITLAVIPENVKAVDWYNANWLQRQAYTITNGETTAYTNVTVDIYLTEANNADVFDHCRSDSYDIRFVNYGNAQTFEHYRAYWNYADHDAFYQVLIPSLPASTSTTIWIYYGNSAATTDTSNGSAVFSLFDDFSYSTYRNVTTQAFEGDIGGGIWEKYPTAEYTPSASPWETNQQKMMGISAVYNATEGDVVAYGSYVNASYAVICGMNNTNGYGTDWNRFSNILVNHSATGASPDFLKATEPDFMTNISESWHRAIDTGYLNTSYTLYYSGLNATNWSINMASALTSGPIDIAWTKFTYAPCLINRTTGSFDSAGVRKPVVWNETAAGVPTPDLKMLYGGTTDGSTFNIGLASSSDYENWTQAYTWSQFNKSSFGWDNKSVLPLDVYNDGTNYTMIYAGSDWQDVWRIGVATTTDFIAWTRQGGYLGIGDTSDWDSAEVAYATWISNDNDRWSVYYTGKNSSSVVAMGYADVMNSQITSWGQWHNDGVNGVYFVNAEDQLEVQWNTTQISRNVNLANYSVMADLWATGTGTHNETIFMRSDGGAMESSEDFYQNAVNSNANVMDTQECVGGTATVLDQQTFYYNGTAQQFLKIRAYGSYIYTYSEGLDTNNTATGTATDTTRTSGEIGLAVYTQPKVKFDNFRSLATNNGTVTVTSGSSEDWSAETPTGGNDGGGATPEDDDTQQDDTTGTSETDNFWTDFFDDIGDIIVDAFSSIWVWAGILLILVERVIKFKIPYLPKNAPTLLGILLILIGLLLLFHS